jgi:molybdopterin synthase catalytic subunit
MWSRVRVQPEPLEPLAPQAELWGGRPGVGAVVSFIGLMRDFNAGQAVQGMTLEHYPGMTEKALQAIVDQAGERWDLEAVQLVHRVGGLRPQDPIVLVAVASAHRGEAFRACEFIIDYLKTRAPFWKKEQRADGEHWVEARARDREADRRWQSE